jgi:hypothetical protein
MIPDPMISFCQQQNAVAEATPWVNVVRDTTDDDANGKETSFNPQLKSHIQHECTRNAEVIVRLSKEWRPVVDARGR